MAPMFPLKTEISHSDMVTFQVDDCFLTTYASEGVHEQIYVYTYDVSTNMHMVIYVYH